ncbi:MAG: FkbM family methyltransferase [bacterium]
MEHRAKHFFRRLINSRVPSSASFVEVERAERMYYLQYLREGMTVFDVGANIGELTLMFSRFVGDGGRVHAFEPSLAPFGKLKLICTAASLRNVQLNQIALAEQAGTVTLHCYGEDYQSWTSQALRPLESYGIDVRAVSTEEATAITLDHYCQRNSIASIDLLKIDVEGAEFQVLLGARRMLEARQIRCVAFEFGQTTFDMKNDPTEIEAYLKSLGYVLRNLVAGDPIFPGRQSAQTASFSMHIATPAGARFT